MQKKLREARLNHHVLLLLEKLSLNEKLSWYEKKPLFGTNICITRSREQSKI